MIQWNHNTLLGKESPSPCYMQNNNAYNHPFRYHPSIHSSFLFSSPLCLQTPTQTWAVFLHRSGGHGDGATQARFAARTIHTLRCKQFFSSSFFARYCVASSSDSLRGQFACRPWRGDGAGSVPGHRPRICKLLLLQRGISTGHFLKFGILYSPACIFRINFCLIA